MHRFSSHKVHKYRKREERYIAKHDYIHLREHFHSKKIVQKGEKFLMLVTPFFVSARKSYLQRSVFLLWLLSLIFATAHLISLLTWWIEAGDMIPWPPTTKLELEFGQDEPSFVKAYNFSENAFRDTMFHSWRTQTPFLLKQTDERLEQKRKKLFARPFFRWKECTVSSIKEGRFKSQADVASVVWRLTNLFHLNVAF